MLSPTLPRHLCGVGVPAHWSSGRFDASPLSLPPFFRSAERVIVNVRGSPLMVTARMSHKNPTGTAAVALLVLEKY